MSKKVDVFALQEDDWGLLRIVAVDPLNGETNIIRTVKFDEIFADDARILVRGATTICQIDYDGVCAFFTKDGRRTFATAEPSDNWNGQFQRQFMHTSGDAYFFYCKTADNKWARYRVDALNRTVVKTELFDISTFPEFGSADFKAAWETNGDLYAITRNYQGDGFSWKLVAGVWTHWDLGIPLNTGTPLDYWNRPYSIADSQVEWVVQTNNDSRNFDKIVLDISVPSLSQVSIATNVYSTAPPVFPPASNQFYRRSVCETPNYGWYYNPTEENQQYTHAGTPCTVGPANSGPGGQGRGLIIGPNDGLMWNSSFAIRQESYSQVWMFDVYFDSVAGTHQLLTEQNGKGFYLKDGKIAICSDNVGAVVNDQTDQTLVAGQWYRLAFGHAIGVTNEFRVSIDGNVEALTATYNELWALSIGRAYTAAVNSGFSGMLGGIGVYGNMNQPWHYRGEQLTDVPMPATIDNSPIVNYAGVSRGQMIVGGTILRDGNNSDGATPRWIDDGSLFNLPNGNYTPTISNVEQTWNNYPCAFRVGAFFLQIGMYGFRTINAAGDELFLHLQRTDDDRELGYYGYQVVFRNCDLYEVTGLVKDSSNNPLANMKLRLLDDDSSEELSTTVTDAQGRYRFYCLTNQPVTVKLDSNSPVKNAKISAHCIPTLVAA